MFKKLKKIFQKKLAAQATQCSARKKIVNIINDGENNTIEVDESIKPENLRIHVIGNNNTIHIGPTTRIKSPNAKLSILIKGNHCSLEIGERFYTCTNTSILIGNMVYDPVENSHVKIGNSLCIEDGRIVIMNSNANIIIGNDCMFAHNICIFNTDAHPIYDQSSEKPINKVGTLKIGNNCWLGENAVILKNVSLSDYTIVGYASVVSKSFDEAHIAIAGNPARKIKSGLSWKTYDKNYVKNK